MSTYWLYLFLILFLCIIRVSPFMVNTFLTFCPDFLALCPNIKYLTLCSYIFDQRYFWDCVQICFGTVTIFWIFFYLLFETDFIFTSPKMVCDLSQHGVPAPSHLEGGVPAPSHFEGGLNPHLHVLRGVRTRTLNFWGGLESKPAPSASEGGLVTVS